MQNVVSFNDIAVVSVKKMIIFFLYMSKDEAINLFLKNANLSKKVKYNKLKMDKKLQRLVILTLKNTNFTMAKAQF